MKPFPWKCGKCRQRAVNPATLDHYSTELDHDGRAYSVTLSDFQVAKCDNCGSIVLDDAANRRLSDALRSHAGLLHNKEIRARREALGLTQKALAGYLQVAEATLSRWETGCRSSNVPWTPFCASFSSPPTPERSWGSFKSRRAANSERVSEFKLPRHPINVKVSDSAIHAPSPFGTGLG